MQKRIIKNQRNENVIDIEEPQLPASTEKAFGEGIIQHPKPNDPTQIMSSEGINGVTPGNKNQKQNNNNQEITSNNLGIISSERIKRTNGINNDSSVNYQIRAVKDVSYYIDTNEE